MKAHCGERLLFVHLAPSSFHDNHSEVDAIQSADHASANAFLPEDAVRANLVAASDIEQTRVPDSEKEGQDYGTGGGKIKVSWA